MSKFEEHFKVVYARSHLCADLCSKIDHKRRNFEPVTPSHVEELQEYAVDLVEAVKKLKKAVKP